MQFILSLVFQSYSSCTAAVAVMSIEGVSFHKKCFYVFSFQLIFVIYVLLLFQYNVKFNHIPKLH